MNHPRPWRAALAWLAFLGPFFYLSYGVANWLAARRDDVGAIVFDWERSTPFLAWTIVPYWTINAFYAASLFLCRDRGELGRHARRLLTAQVIAVACFLLFPLTITFERPETNGLPGMMFAALTRFDQPYNQAPSLHIALLVILWDLYRRILPKAWLPVLHAWSLLIGVSVLTTYQHHFIDIPTGALLGWCCVWLWPLRGATPIAAAQLTADPRRRLLALRYALAATVVFLLALGLGGAALWLAWGAVSLLFVAANYAWLGTRGFQKSARGRMSRAARWLYAPYLLGAWLNARLWTRGLPVAGEVADGVWIGRHPRGSELAALGIDRVVDLAAELPAAADVQATTVAMLDLVRPSLTELRDAAAAIERHRAAGGRVLVHCALGFSRSAAAVAAWLLQSGRARTIDDALELVRRARPNIVLNEDHRHTLVALQQEALGR